MEPKENKKFYKRWWFWVLLIIFGPLVLNSVLEPKTTTVTESVPTHSASVNTYSFDMPSLVGKDVDELKQTLGTPSDDIEPTEQQLKLGTDTWDKTWKAGNHLLLATYDVKTREVVDLFIGSNNDATFESFKLKVNIRNAGNLKDGDPGYEIEYVKALKGGGYTGAIVREK